MQPERFSLQPTSILKSDTLSIYLFTTTALSLISPRNVLLSQYTIMRKEVPISEVSDASRPSIPKTDFEELINAEKLCPAVKRCILLLLIGARVVYNSSSLLDSVCCLFSAPPPWASLLESQGSIELGGSQTLLRYKRGYMYEIT